MIWVATHIIRTILVNPVVRRWTYLPSGPFFALRKGDTSANPSDASIRIACHDATTHVRPSHRDVERMPLLEALLCAPLRVKRRSDPDVVT